MGEEEQVVRDEVRVVGDEDPGFDAGMDGLAQGLAGLDLEALDLRAAGRIERLRLAIGEHSSVAVLVDDPAVCRESGGEAAYGIVAGLGDRDRHVGRERVEDLEDDGEDDLVLAAEVAVDEAHADTRLGGERLHGDGLGSLALHESRGGVEELTRSVLGARLACHVVRLGRGVAHRRPFPSWVPS